MKKTVLLLTLGFMLTGLSMHVKAQGYFNRAQEGEIKFGIRGGANYFSLGTIDLLEGEDYEDIGLSEDFKYNTKHKIGFQIGVYADIWMSPVLSFRPEINFIRKGGKLTDTITINLTEPDDPFGIELNFPLHINSEFYYVEAPLLFAVKPLPSLSLFAGPQASYLIFQKLTWFNPEASGDDEMVGTEGLQKFIVGGAAGAQFDITPNININARYTTDFQSAFKKDQNQPKMRNSGVALSIGYTF